MLTPVLLANDPNHGHYVPAMIYAGLVYVSGTLPAVRETDAVTAGTPFKDQMHQLLRNCLDILTAAGSSEHKVISFTLYLLSLDDWDVANDLLAAFFGSHRPARAVICVPQIRKGYAAQATLVAAV